MKLVIRKTVSADAPALKTLWRSAFADSPEYTDFALFGIDPEECGLAAFDGEKLICMLFLIPAVLCVDGITSSVRYVYSVATDPAYRNRGIFRELDTAAEKLALNEGAKALVLVPAEAELYPLYQKLGYRTRFYLSKTRVSGNVASGAVLLPCSPEEFQNLRASLLKKRGNYCDLDTVHGEYRYYEYLFPCPGRSRGELFRVEARGVVGYTAGYLLNKTYVIQETDLEGWALSDAAGALCERTGARDAVMIGTLGKRAPYGMIKLLDPSLDRKRVRLADLYMNLMLT